MRFVTFHLFFIFFLFFETNVHDFLYVAYNSPYILFWLLKEKDNQRLEKDLLFQLKQGIANSFL